MVFSNNVVVELAYTSVSDHVVRASLRNLLIWRTLPIDPV